MSLFLKFTLPSLVLFFPYFSIPCINYGSNNPGVFATVAVYIAVTLFIDFLCYFNYCTYNQHGVLMNIYRHDDTPIPLNSKPVKFLDRYRTWLRLNGYAWQTEKHYIMWVAKLELS